MLTIRLQRTGKRNQADFRIVLAEKEAPVKKKIVEILGSYNPRKKNFQVKEERVKYWIAQKVGLSETVHNLFVTKSLLDAKKVKAFNIPKKPSSAEATAAKAAEPAAETPASESALETTETPAEAKEANLSAEALVKPEAAVEAKVESPAAEDKPAKAIPEATEQQEN